MRKCADCGQRHVVTRPLNGKPTEMASCAAHKRRSRPPVPCGQPPAKGQRVCRIHGGRTPSAIAKVQQERRTVAVEKDIKRTLAHEGITAVSNPYDELARLAAEVIAFKDALAARVNALEDVIRYVAVGPGTEQLRSEVVLYERALDRSGRFLEALVKSGFEERRVKIDEQIGAEVAALIQRILNQLDLTEDQRQKAPAIVAGELLKVEDSS